MPAKKATAPKRTRRIYKKAPKKEHFTAAELADDPQSEMAARIDSLEQRVAALERKAEETPDDPDER